MPFTRKQAKRLKDLGLNEKEKIAIKVLLELKHAKPCPNPRKTTE